MLDAKASNREDYRARVGSAHLYVKRLDSTNSLLLNSPALLRQDGLVLTASCQTAGRGRHGRQWVAPGGENLYLSLVIHGEHYPIEPPSFTLVAGLALFLALEELGIKGLSLKWPNDLLVGQRKIAGILTELKLEGGKPRLVVGIGVNLNGDSSDYPAELREKVTTFSEQVGRSILASEMQNALVEKMNLLLNRVLDGGFVGLVDEWVKKSQALGRRVRYEHLGDTREGSIAGLNESGHLLVLDDQSSQEVAVFSGEVIYI